MHDHEFLGLDLSQRHFGLARYSPANDRQVRIGENTATQLQMLLDSGEIRGTDPNQTGVSRDAGWQHRILRQIEPLENVKYVAIEIVRNYRSQPSRLTLMRRIAALREVLTAHWPTGIPVLYVDSQDLKRFATCQPGATKYRVQAVIRDEWGVVTSDYDQADAAVLARMAYCAFVFANRGNIRNLRLLPEQRQVLRRILN